jgi:antitoxin (DNA-binding transcriptional repressor) of toxin-antitoxin stability system
MASPSRRRRRASVSATEAAKNFGALVDRVRESAVAYTIERQGRPIAQITPVAVERCTLADFVAWVDRRNAGSPDFAREVRRAVRRANRPRVPTSRWRS